MSIHDTKVIGFFAYASASEVVCTEQAACVITGSQKSMEEYIKELDPQNLKKRTIKKTRFVEIMQGLQLGAAYGFDEDAYNRFYPIAKDIGLDVQQADFEEKRSEGLRFFTVQIKSN
ncbi:hypothetical protein H8E88_30720 [candidate division KSB1 bacterium]|nr:hypothetical protein [candidate division KSB1 bacterium]